MEASAPDGADASTRAGGHEHGSGGPPLPHAKVQRDETLQHPRTVFQILKRHFSRYTPEMVRDMCGISVDEFTYLAESIADNSGRDRTTCFGYATGWTQHTLGAQFIRTAAILQLLLGNVGRPGSGIMALRGHASIQGSTDIPTLFVAAEIDPGCPPPLTEAAARGYSNSQVVIVTNATHGVINASPCTRKMARDFLRALAHVDGRLLVVDQAVDRRGRLVGDQRGQGGEDPPSGAPLLLGQQGDGAGDHHPYPGAGVHHRLDPVLPGRRHVLGDRAGQGRGGHARAGAGHRHPDPEDQR